jgi:hypothetical protein
VVLTTLFGTVIDSELRALGGTGVFALFEAVSSPISKEWDAERFIARDVFVEEGPGAAAASCNKKAIFFVTSWLMCRT